MVGKPTSRHSHFVLAEVILVFCGVLVAGIFASCCEAFPPLVDESRFLGRLFGESSLVGSERSTRRITGPSAAKDGEHPTQKSTKLCLEAPKKFIRGGSFMTHFVGVVTLRIPKEANCFRNGPIPILRNIHIPLFGDAFNIAFFQLKVSLPWGRYFQGSRGTLSVCRARHGVKRFGQFRGS